MQATAANDHSRQKPSTEGELSSGSFPGDEMQAKGYPAAFLDHLANEILSEVPKPSLAVWLGATSRNRALLEQLPISLLSGSRRNLRGTQPGNT